MSYHTLKQFNILPYITIYTYKNGFTEDFKKEAPWANWENQTTLWIGWLWWNLQVI